MAKDVEDAPQTEEDQDSGALKKKVADQAADGSVQTTEDPTRASLHYGEDHEMETSSVTPPDGQADAYQPRNDAQPKADSQSTSDESDDSEPSSRIGDSSSSPTTDTPARTEGSQASDDSEQTSSSSFQRPTPQTSDTAAPASSTQDTSEQRASFTTEPSNSQTKQQSDGSDGPSETEDDEVGSDPEAEPQEEPDTAPSSSDEQAPPAETAEPTPEPVSETEPVEEAEPIEIEQENSAPSAVSMTNTSVAENADGAVIGTLDVTDADMDDDHSFTVSDDKFEIVGDTVKLKDGVSFNYDDIQSIPLEITATDGAGGSVTQSFTIDIDDLNEAPSGLSLDISQDNLIKNGSFEDFTLRKGRWKGFEEDQSGAWTDSNGIEIWDRLGGVQASDGKQLMEMDHGNGIDSISQVVQTSEGQVYDLGMDLRERIADGTDTVEVYWNGTLVGELNPDSSDWETFQMQVVGTGEDTLELREASGESDSYGALVDNITLVAAPATIAENVEGAVIGQVNFDDPDMNDTHEVTVSDDRFEVVDGTLRLKEGVALDHEEDAVLSLEITATDSGGASVTETFDINVADVNEAPESVSLSNTAVAKNVEGAVVGQLDVTDMDANDTLSLTLSDDRFEVVDGTVKLKDGVALDGDDAATISLDVTATDSAGASMTQSFDINVAEVPEATMTTGFRAEYFDVDQSLSVINDVDWDASPTHAELVGDINYENSRDSFWEGGDTDTFGARLTGNIEVSEAGTFTFDIGGDDGVVLLINGVEVIANDGEHAYQSRSGEIELEPGTHVIEVKYFENYGLAGLKVEWDGPGIDGPELLTPVDVDNLQTVGGAPLTVSIDANQTTSDDAVQHTLEGLPPGTTVQAGDNVGQVDDSGAVDITGWDVSMLSITPPIQFVGQVDATFTTQITLENGQTVSTGMEISFDVNEAHIPDDQVDVFTGFNVSYFDADESISDLDQIDWNDEPTHEEVISEINYENGTKSFWDGGDTDTFGAKITGQFTVEEGGIYDFYLGADDGVVLYINGVEVIEDNGLHSYRTQSGEIELEPGTHEIEVRYFENYQHAGLKLEWDGPDTDGRELVQADPDMSIAQNGILDIQITAEPSDTVTLTGLPPHTIIVSGEDTSVVDGSDVDISGWNLDMIEIMPPNDYAGEINAQITVESTAFNGAETETIIPLTITVGNEEDWETAPSSDDDMYLASQDSENEASNGWAADEKADPEGSADESDDPMQEQVEMNQGAEQSGESYDTYERQDW